MAIFGAVNHIPKREQAPGSHSSWVGYAIAVVLTVVFSEGLRLLIPYLPLAQFPAVYILLLMAVTYYYGLGPAVVAFALSFLAYLYFFVDPVQFFWPPAATSMGWARITAYLIGTLVGGFGAFIIRKSQQRIHAVADELERQRALLEAITLNVPVGLAFVDTDMRYIIANQAIADMRGVTLNQMLGKAIHEILPSEMAEEVEAAGRQVLETGERIVWYEYKPAFDLEERYYTLIRYPVRLADGEMLGVGLVAVDTTDEVVQRRGLEYHLSLLQRALLPAEPSLDEGYRVAAAYVPAFAAEQIGGDFYDVFYTADGEAGVLIGDVSGKGIKAAALAAATRSTVRAFAHQTSSPAQALTQANAVLDIEGVDSDSFVTVFVAIIDTESGTMKYSCAGHPPAMLLHKDGELEYCSCYSPPLGLVNSQRYEQVQSTLQRGDKILLYTDGIIEARHGAEMFGLEGVERTLRAYGERSVRDIVDALLSAANDWAEGRLADDVAILVIERLSEAESR